MKKLQLLLFFALISYCFTQDDECKKEFEKILTGKCTSIDTATCRVTDNENQICLPKNSCSATEEEDCLKLIPENFHKKKCHWDTSGTHPQCTEVDKKCNDYNKITNGLRFGSIDFIDITGDVCSNLNADDDFHHCALDSDGVCGKHLKTCGDFNIQNDCENNIPLNQYPLKQCKWNPGTPGSCSEVPRDCNKYLYDPNKNICKQLTVGSDQKCIYEYDSSSPPSSKCVERFNQCSKYFLRELLFLLIISPCSVLILDLTSLSLIPSNIFPKILFSSIR